MEVVEKTKDEGIKCMVFKEFSLDDDKDVEDDEELEVDDELVSIVYEVSSGSEPKERDEFTYKEDEGGYYATTIDCRGNFLREIGKRDLLEPDEEYTLAKKYKDEGDLSAREDLICRNMRLVVSIAKGFHSYSLTQEDLEQEGFIGLMSAVEKYNPDLGYRFSTYATWWIRQAIQRAICNSGNGIRIPVHALEMYKKYYGWSRRFEADNARFPTRKEMECFCEEQGLPIETIDTIEMCMNSVSIYSPVGENEHGVQSELGDFIPDTSNVSAEETLINQDLRDSLEKLMTARKLTDKEKDVLRLRNGIDVDHAMTLEEIGTIYGVTRERIRQIEEKALRKLKQSRKLHSLLDDFIRS